MLFAASPQPSAPGDWLLTGSNLARKLFSMQFRPEGILQAWLVGTEKGVKSKSMEEENRRKDGGFPNA